MEAELLDDYNLCGQLLPFGGPVRSVDVRGDYMMAGSLDKTARAYKLDPNRKYKLLQTFSLSEGYIYAVHIALVGDTPLFVYAGKDKHLYAFNAENQPVNIIKDAHQDTINSLSGSGNLLVSGSWDSSAGTFTYDQSTVTLSGTGNLTK